MCTLEAVLYITLSKYEEVHDSGLFYCFPSMNKENLSHFGVQAAGDTDFITRFQLQNQSEQRSIRKAQIPQLPPS